MRLIAFVVLMSLLLTIPALAEDPPVPPHPPLGDILFCAPDCPPESATAPATTSMSYISPPYYYGLTVEIGGLGGCNMIWNGREWVNLDGSWVIELIYGYWCVFINNEFVGTLQPQPPPPG